MRPLCSERNGVKDAHLVALGLESGVTLASADRDFGRFAGLGWLELTG
jgi:predicted nucleic acid-binding protein